MGRRSRSRNNLKEPRPVRSGEQRRFVLLGVPSWGRPGGDQCQIQVHPLSSEEKGNRWPGDWEGVLHGSSGRSPVRFGLDGWRKSGSMEESQERRENERE